MSNDDLMREVLDALAAGHSVMFLQTPEGGKQILVFRDLHSEPTPCGGTRWYTVSNDSNAERKIPMENDKPKMEIIHVYAQEFEHQDAFIVGTSAELLRLARACTDAARIGTRSRITTFASDGEGYDLYVIPMSATISMDILPWQYTNNDYRENPPPFANLYRLSGLLPPEPPDPSADEQAEIGEAPGA